MSLTIVLGTRNQKKRAELEMLLAGIDVQLRTLDDFPQAIDVVEDGDTFAANAGKKAAQQAVHLQAWVLGEDSGICVDALDGRPGVYSARYSSHEATDDANNALLLAELRDVPEARRGAHYVCHIALSNPKGEIVIDLEETCRGRIVRAPRGSAGFGYDPLFEIPEYHKTFAELGSVVKGALSHRARATRRLVPQIARLAQAQNT